MRTELIYNKMWTTNTAIGREAKVYERLWSEGNESRSFDHLQDFYFPIYTQRQ